MVTQVNINWTKTLSLDGHISSSIFQDIVNLQKDSNMLSNFASPVISSELINNYDLENIENSIYKSSYSVELKRNLEQTHKAFLEFCQINECDHENNEHNTPNSEQRKTPSRKISFKCKKPTVYRRIPGNYKHGTAIGSNSVSQLASKFNEMTIDKNPILEQPKFARFIRRVNSLKVISTQEETTNKKIARKPSVKIKPTLKPEDNEFKKRILAKQRSSIKNNQKLIKTVNTDQKLVRARISTLEVPAPAQKTELPEDEKHRRSISPANSSLSTGTVRAAIEIFERRSSQSASPDNDNKSITKELEKVPKPKVPEKNSILKNRDWPIKNAIKKLQVFEERQISFQANNDSDVVNSETTISDEITEHSEDKREDETKTCNNQDTNTPLTNDRIELEEVKTDIEEEVQILNIPLVMPRCDSKYETLNLRKISPTPSFTKSVKCENIESVHNSNAVLPESVVKPNTSFLWRQKSQEQVQSTQNTDLESIYDTVEAKPQPPAVPPRPSTLNLNAGPKTVHKKKMPLPEEPQKIYEELEHLQKDSDNVSHSYEYCRAPSKYEDLEQKSDDGYECFESLTQTNLLKSEEMYEPLSGVQQQVPPLPKRQAELLPPRPRSRDSYCTIQNTENVSNCYESIYNSEEKNSRNVNAETISNNYESIYGCNIRSDNWESTSNRDSLISSDQQSNSLYSRSLSGWLQEDLNVYNGKAPSDLSGSDKSDEWIDISDNEESSKVVSGFLIVRERQRNRKASGWSQKIRDQWNKSHSVDQSNSDSDHHYESLYYTQQCPDNDDYDSFDSDTDSENYFNKIDRNDISNSELPSPPISQSYGLTRLAVSAGKHMRRLRRNWSLTKNDITKSLSRMAKRKSRTDLNIVENARDKEVTTIEPTPNEKLQRFHPISSPLSDQSISLASITQELKLKQSDSQTTCTAYQTLQFASKENSESLDTEKSRTNSLSKNKFLNKFRRSMSISNESSTNEFTHSLSHKPKSTFYLTDTIDIDNQKEQKEKEELKSSLSPIVLRNPKVLSQRPQSPPPPIPTELNQIDLKLKNGKRSTSWYAECGLFRNSENINVQNGNKRPNTSWYAEIGLYQTTGSTPSSSSTENSGSITNVNIKTVELDNLGKLKHSEAYYNLKNENDYYNESINSFNSDASNDKYNNVSADLQLRLQDEPLYQFYDAAVLESVCQDGTTDFDYDGYEEVGDKSNSGYSGYQITSRPSAMQLVSPTRNGVTVVRTLWCEIPEVVQSTVLSTLSLQQKKIQEAKFEMMTSEASYLNSLNVLTDHFISNFNYGNLLSYEESSILFGKIPAVKRCSEKLLLDLEKCWQDNILLHGISDIIKTHAEENFYVYVSYCENQILLDSTLKKMKERSNCSQLLKQLECSSACQSLTLYSFLMLPMQRITRWPLLVDAVLKRLSPQDDEYLSCQYTLATINKIVTQCNEAARRMERETEIKKIASQLEFPRSIPLIKLTADSRWLVKSGPLTQMIPRTDDLKLTFGKRFSKISLNLFLFNDLLLVTKSKSDDYFIVLHYCYRSYIELNMTDIGSFPLKDSQGRHLLFLTILENHEGKTIELLLSCNSESDKERWIEALTPPKSEDPDETLYECWDCPQVTAVHPYAASQPDELALSKGDIVNVTRKMADGWYHGERIRDGQTGWFPANYSVEVANPHVRARNLKQRYRLLAFSENYLKTK